MNIELPADGCNIITSSGFYNYNGTTRSTYVIYDGVAHLSDVRTAYTQDITGTCLKTGDLVYKPELEVYYTLASVLTASVIIYLAVRLILYKFWRRIR